MRIVARWFPFVLLLGAFGFAVWLLSSDDSTSTDAVVIDGPADTTPEPHETPTDREDPIRIEDPVLVRDPTPAERPHARASVNGRVQFAGTTRAVRGGSVEFVYLDPRDTGEPPDLVQAWSEERKSDHESYDETPIRRDGSFELLLPVGSILRRATMKPSSLDDDLLAGFFDTERDLGDRILTEAGVTLSLSAWEGYTISGRVVEAGTGAPIADARVLSVWWNLTTSRYGTRSDDRGEFRIGGLHPEVIPLAPTTDVVAEHPEFVTSRVEVDIDPEASEITGVEITMQRGVVVTGRVVDEQDRPRRNVELHLYEHAADPGPVGLALEQHVRTRSAPDGAFRFPAVRPASSVELYGRASTAVAMSRTVDARQDLDHEVFVLPSGVILEVEAHAPGVEEPLDNARCHAVLTRGGVHARAVRSTRDGPSLEVRAAAGTTRTLEVAAWLDDALGGRRLYGTAVVYAEHVPGDDSRVIVPVHLEDLPNEPAPFPNSLSATPYFGVDFRLWLWGFEPGPSTTGPATVSVSSAPLRLDTPVSDAGVLEFRVGGGRHFLELRSPGYRPRRFALDVGAYGRYETELLLERTTR